MVNRLLQCVCLLIAGGVIGLTPASTVQDGARGQDRPARRDAGPDRGAERVHDGRRDRQFPRTLTAEQRNSIIEVIADLRPLAPEERQRLQSLDAGEFRSFFMQQGGQILNLVRLRESRPALYSLKVEELKLARQSYRLVREYHRAVGSGNRDEARRAEQQLQSILSQHLDTELKIVDHEIAILEEQVQRKRNEAERARQHRDAVLNERMRGMLERGRNGDGAGRDRPGAGGDRARDRRGGGG